MDIIEICQKAHGAVDLSALVPTEREHIYKYKQGLSEFCYYKDFVFVEYHPILDDTEMNSLQGVDRFHQRIDKHLNNNDYVNLFSIIEKKIALPKYLEVFHQIPDEQKYDTFIEVYTRSEFGFEMLKDKYHEIFEYKDFSEERKERLMNFYLQFSNKVKIYHGESFTFPVYDYYSWSTSKTVAKKFAYRFNGEGEIWEKLIPLKDAIDFIDSRNEQEVLYDYQKEGKKCQQK